MRISVCKCDICGKEIVTEPDWTVDYYGWIDDRHTKEYKYELCRECAEKIIPNLIEIMDLAKKGITVK